MDKEGVRILFFGFGDVGGKCLKFMLENGYNVVGVFTHDRDSHESHWFEEPELLAQKYGVPVFKPKKLDAQWAEKVAELKPDLLLSLYYRNRIPEEIFSQAKMGAYNLHGSYLPAYKGRAPLNWAIINGENYTGVSLHVLEKDFDTGDIVARKKVEFTDSDYVGDIIPRVSKAALEMFSETLPAFVSGNVAKIPQSSLSEKSSYFGKRTPEMGRIDFSQSARQIRNLVRAVSRPFNGAFFDINGKRFTLWRVDVAPNESDAKTGEILEQSPALLKIAATDGTLVSTDFSVEDLPETTLEK